MEVISLLTQMGQSPNFKVFQVDTNIENFYAAVISKSDNQNKIPSNVVFSVIRTPNGMYCYMDMHPEVVKSQSDYGVVQGPDKKGNYILKDTQVLFDNLTSMWRHFKDSTYTHCYKPQAHTAVTVKIKNSCSYPIYIAHNYEMDSKPRYERVQGWNRVNPNSSTEVYLEDINPNQYYYAIKYTFNGQQAYYKYRNTPHKSSVLNINSNFDYEEGVNLPLGRLDGYGSVTYKTFYQFPRSNPNYSKGAHLRFNLTPGCPR